MQDWWEATFPKGRQTLTISDFQGYPVQIAYGSIGTGKPLFLLHGVGSWSYCWRNCIKPLSQNFQVICVDAKGYGFSEKPLNRREESGHQIIELKRIIKALVDKPVTIVGESLGGLTGLGLAETDPDLIERLIVINVPIFTQRLPHWGMNLLSIAPLEIVNIIDNLRLTNIFAPFVREILGRERRQVLFNPKMLKQEDIYWISYPFIEISGTLTKAAEELQIAAQAIANWHLKKPNLLSQIQNNLHQITCPTLILWGEHDTWFDKEDGEKLHQCIPDSLFQVLPNCGHDAAYGAADRVTKAILDFCLPIK